MLSSFHIACCHTWIKFIVCRATLTACEMSSGVWTVTSYKLQPQQKGQHSWGSHALDYTDLLLPQGIAFLDCGGYLIIRCYLQGWRIQCCLCSCVALGDIYSFEWFHDPPRHWLDIKYGMEMRTRQELKTNNESFKSSFSRETGSCLRIPLMSHSNHTFHYLVEAKERHDVSRVYKGG